MKRARSAPVDSEIGTVNTGADGKIKKAVHHTKGCPPYRKMTEENADVHRLVWEQKQNNDRLKAETKPLPELQKIFSTKLFGLDFATGSASKMHLLPVAL